MRGARFGRGVPAPYFQSDWRSVAVLTMVPSPMQRVMAASAGLLALLSLAAVEVSTSRRPARAASAAVMWQPAEDPGAAQTTQEDAATAGEQSIDVTMRLYRVRSGDTWASVAMRFGLSRAALRAYNPDAPSGLRAGQALEVWFDGEPPPERPGGLELDVSTRGLSLAPIPEGSQSIGAPDRGRLLAGVRLPDNPALYHLRRPDHAYGSSYALEHLQLGVAKFHAHHDYPRPVLISDMSPRRGRRFPPHSSHQSGRDVDIWLPTLSTVTEGMPAARAKDVDWDATWALTKSLVRTGAVQFIFLSSSRQKHLLRAAKRDGMAPEQLHLLIQFPRRSKSAIVRHAPGHDKHMHVRFLCGPEESRCR